MALQLSNPALYGEGFNKRNNPSSTNFALERVKSNTPFGYYDNDSEFVKDAMRATAFVAQRLGVVGNSSVATYITDLTVYACMEEAVTTYGNMVYQFKVRDNYINLEGSNTLPFSQTDVADKIVLSEDPTINSTVFWSNSRTATWAEIEFDLPNSSSAAGGEIFVMSASLNDFLAPDVKKIKNWNIYYYQNPVIPVDVNYDWSTTTYPQFNRIGGDTVATLHYSSSFTTFDITDLAIYTSFPGSSSFSVTGSNGNEFLFVVTASSLPNDTPTTFYIATGSTADETANNIANKINSVASNFGLIVTANTGSTPVVLDITSSFGSTIDPVNSGFQINYLDISNNPVQVVFTINPGTYNTYQITDGESWAYFFTTFPKQNFWPSNTDTINTA